MNPTGYNGTEAIPPRERLLRRIVVDQERGCWLWQGSVARGGYGQIKVGSRRDRSVRMMKAHRVAYEAFVGPIPAGLDILHRCDVPRCCRPGHLYPGTYVENVADRGARGRTARGEKQWNARLDTQSVHEIRRRVANGEPAAAVACDYGISRTHVNYIARRKSWRHV